MWTVCGKPTGQTIAQGDSGQAKNSSASERAPGLACGLRKELEVMEGQASSLLASRPRGDQPANGGFSSGNTPQPKKSLCLNHPGLAHFLRFPPFTHSFQRREAMLPVKFLLEFLPKLLGSTVLANQAVPHLSTVMIQPGLWSGGSWSQDGSGSCENRLEWGKLEGSFVRKGSWLSRKQWWRPRPVGWGDTVKTSGGSSEVGRQRGNKAGLSDQEALNTVI